MVTYMESIFDKSPDKQWLNPIAMSNLKRAVQKKKDRVILHGIEYRITYGHILTYTALRETVESIHLARTDGQFAPRGYVELRRILNFEFEED